MTRNNTSIKKRQTSPWLDQRFKRYVVMYAWMHKYFPNIKLIIVIDGYGVFFSFHGSCIQLLNVGSNLQMNQHRRQQDHKEIQQPIVTKILSFQIGAVTSTMSKKSCYENPWVSFLVQNDVKLTTFQQNNKNRNCKLGATGLSWALMWTVGNMQSVWT